jgi:sRNA-binding protein
MANDILVANSTIRAAIAARVPDLLDADAERSRRIAHAERLHAAFLSRQDIRDTLVDYYGAAVFDNEAPTPLAIGIHYEIIELLDGVFDRAAISDFLRWWVHQPKYLAALARGDARRGLDGEVVAEVDYEHRLIAHNALFLQPRAAMGGAP